jgi:hypothetical protein
LIKQLLQEKEELKNILKEMKNKFKWLEKTFSSHK